VPFFLRWDFRHVAKLEQVLTTPAPFGCGWLHLWLKMGIRLSANFAIARGQLGFPLDTMRSPFVKIKFSTGTRIWLTSTTPIDLTVHKLCFLTMRSWLLQVLTINFVAERDTEPVFMGTASIVKEISLHTTLYLCDCNNLVDTILKRHQLDIVI